MKVLVIGGTKFIGREVVRLATEAGHDVTLFNRGRTGPDSAIKTIRGDVAELSRYQTGKPLDAPEGEPSPAPLQH